MAFDDVPGAAYAGARRWEITNERAQEILDGIRREIREDKALARQLLEATSRHAA